MGVIILKQSFFFWKTKNEKPTWTLKSNFSCEKLPNKDPKVTNIWSVVYTYLTAVQ